MSNYTPGPWVYKRNEVNGDTDHIATVAWCSDYVVGKDCGHAYDTNFESHGSDESDARLIAAAPDMVKACAATLAGYPGWQQMIEAAYKRAVGDA